MIGLGWGGDSHKLGKEEISLNTINIIQEKLTTNMIHNAFHLDQGEGWAVHSHHFYSPLYQRLQSAQEEKETKGTQDGLKEVKRPLFADNIIMYIENPKKPKSKGKLQIISEFINVTGY